MKDINKMTRTGLIRTIVFLLGFFCGTQLVMATQDYPFQINTYNLSGAPAVLMNRGLTATDKIYVRNGHYYTQSNNRVRFWGINLSPHMLFPVNDTAADRVAAHLERMGINLVRVHALDAIANPSFMGLVDSTLGYPYLSQTNLIALDRFLSALRAHGIYIDLVLKTGGGIQASPMDLFNRQMIDQQKQYAQSLLTHIVQNYNDVLAMIEINNENSLTAYYWLEQTKPLPQAYADELTNRWNAWLLNTYGSTANLAGNWVPGQSSVSDPGLKNGGFSSGVNPARAPWAASDWYITDTTCPGWDGITYPYTGSGSSSADDLWTTGTVDAYFELQLNAHTKPCKHYYTFLGQNNLSLVTGASYWLQFRAAATPARNIGLSLQQMSGTYASAWPAPQVAIAGTAQDYDYCFSSTLTATDIRLAFFPWVSRDTDANTSDPLDNQAGVLSLDNVSLSVNSGVALLPDEHLADVGGAGTVQRPQPWASGCPTFSAQRFKDYANFLASIERDYYTEMRDFVRSIAGSTPVTGSQVFFGGSHGGLIGNKNMADLMDFADAHLYWDHPTNTGSASWTMDNIPMVEYPADYRSLPAYIAASRVSGLPLTISEYSPNHTNRYAEEGYLMMSAYAALQDIDAVMVFDHYVWNKYNYPGTSGYDPNVYYELMPTQLDGWYSVLGETRAEALMHLAANIFRRADIAAARNMIVLNVSDAMRINQTTSGNSVKQVLENVSDGSTNFDVRMGLISRLTMTHTDSPQSALLPLPQPPYISDTGELDWNYQPDSSRFIVDGQRTKAVSGYLRNSSALNGMTITGLGGSTQFGVLSATAMDNRPLATSQQILITTISEGKNRYTKYVPQAGRVQLCYDGDNDGICPNANGDAYYDNPADKYFYDAEAGPFYVTNNPARVRLTGAATIIRVQRLGTDGQLKKDANGNVMPDIFLTPIADGYEFDVGADGDDTPWYLVTSILPQAQSQTRLVETEDGQISGDPAYNKRVLDSNASGTGYVQLAATGGVTLVVPDDLPSDRYYVEVKAAGLEDNGPPMIGLSVNGAKVGNNIALADVLGRSWVFYLAGNTVVNLPAGTGRTITLNYDPLANGVNGNRYVFLDYVRLYRAGTQPNGDLDSDGVVNSQDNCPTVSNPTQTDSNGNGSGDACDPVDVSISLTATPDPANTDSPLTYTVTASNAGPSPASAVVVTHTLPAGVTGSGIPSQGSCTGTGVISCNLGTLSNGQSATITVTATPGAEALFDATPSMTFSVNVSASTTVSAMETDPVPVNNSATATTNVRLACLGKVVTQRGTSSNDGTSSNRFEGTNGADVIHTLSGDDWIAGKGGNDTICGGAGNDNVNGNGGADTLSGGPGTDTCNGGSGTDSTDGSCESWTQ